MSKLDDLRWRCSTWTCRLLLRAVGVESGTRVIVIKGVSIGDGSIVGAGSVVTTDVPAGTIAAGSPARVVADALR
jgi:serine acetyltransferase